MLVLVTDGFIDDAPLAELRARLDRARIETIALAVGPDADVSALERLVGGESGVVLRVNEAAELPLVMRAGVERRRARVERGTIAVTQRQPLPFTPGTLKDWPAVAAYAVTRPQPAASVSVQTERGDPLIAIPKVRPGPRGCRDKRTGKLDPTLVAVARMAAARRRSDRLDQRITAARRGHAGRVGRRGRASGRGRFPDRRGWRRHGRRIRSGADADDAEPVAVDESCRPWPVAGDAARRRFRPLHVPGFFFARYPAPSAPPATSCGERDVGHEPGAGHVEDRRTCQRLEPWISCAASRQQPDPSSSRSLAGRTGSRVLPVRHSCRPREASQGKRWQSGEGTSRSPGIGSERLSARRWCQLQKRTRSCSLDSARNPPIVIRACGPEMRPTRCRQRPEASRKRSPGFITKRAHS